MVEEFPICLFCTLISKQRIQFGEIYFKLLNLFLGSRPLAVYVHAGT